MSMRILVLIISLLCSICKGQGPIVSYSFDNEQAIDKINGLNGELKGGAFACSDRFGNKCAAIYFNGIDGYIEVPHSPIFNSINNAFSVSFWFKIDVGESNYLTAVCKGSNLSETSENPHFRVQNFQFTTNSTVSISTDYTQYDIDYLNHVFPSGIWNFYTITYDGYAVKTYLNNIKVFEMPFNGILVPNNDPLFIARDIPGIDEYFKGALDDLKIYNRAINESEILNLFIEKNNQLLLPDFELELPSNLIVYTAPNACAKKVVYSAPKLSINCESKVSLNQVSGLKSGSEFQIGEHIISYSAISETGYNKTVSFKIIVKDNIPPFIVSRKDTTVWLNSNIDSMIVNYLSPVYRDNCSNVKMKLKSGKKSGDYFHEGIHNITFEATDNAGNISTITINVTVKKQITSKSISSNKTITIKTPKRQKYSDSILISDKGKCAASFKLKVLDSNDFIKNPTTRNYYSVGQSTVIINNKRSDYTDTFNLVVLDRELPSLHCLNDTVIYANNNLDYSEFDAELPNSDDNCGIDTIYELNGIKDFAKFPIGLTELQYKAIDLSGNSIMCKRKIEVIKLNNSLSKVNSLGRFSFLPDTLFFSAKYITIRIYDNKQEDNDTVSIYFNGNEIIQRQEIRNKSNATIVRVIQLKNNVNHEMTFKAWNLGGIPPNTLKIEFFEGDISQTPSAFKKQKPKFVKIISSTPDEGSGLFLNTK